MGVDLGETKGIDPNVEFREGYNRDARVRIRDQTMTFKR